MTWLDGRDAAIAKIPLVDKRTSDLAGYDTTLLVDMLQDCLT
ncbi:hypothetical protein [Streptomyces afghaniensis]|nr:hypothetical protein [Streptomyces afghaniensis]MDQ1019872.1 hypothetical protein [Streptomyces afghaniensis]